ncbi:cytochrome ubiquinol oxidase subunit I, partial [Bacillus thuringiensis]
MLLLGAYGWFLSRKDRLAEKTWYLKLMVYAISLPFIGNTVGWIMTEMGRQPWVVFGVMKTEDAVSPNVTFGEVLFSLISFTSMYLIMGGICVYLFVRTIKGHTNKKTKKDYQSHDPFDKEEEYVIS